MDMAERSGGIDQDDFSGLPEGCISDVVALTSTRDACRLSVVSSLLKTVAESDSVWARFMPQDISAVLSRASGSLPQFSSLKQLYFNLCNSPILLDGGKMSFSLDRSSGRKCYMLSARALAIVWGETPMYWRWTSIPDSRFLEVAELITVSWLEIRGRIDVGMLSPSTLYAAYLVFKFTPDSYGFKSQPIEVRVGLVDGEATQRTVYLDVRGEGRNGYPEERGDGWLEMGLGEFFCEEDCDGEMEMKVLEVRKLFWKGGLIIHGIEIRPKERITM